jgi:hypothetical protein
MPQVLIEVIYPLPEGWGICLSCEMLMARANLDKAPHERGLDEYPAEWRAEFERLSSIIYELAARYQEKVLIRLWDPRSLQGLWKAIRYGAHRYPTFVINGQVKLSGWEQDIEAAVEKSLAA